MSEIDCFREVDGSGERGHDVWMNRGSVCHWRKVDEWDVVDRDVQMEDESIAEEKRRD